jgi:hypothetical protein
MLAIVKRLYLKGRIDLPIVLFIAAIFSMNSSCATNKKAIADEDLMKAWSGTWISAETNNQGLKFLKAIFNPDGSYDYYYELRDAVFQSTTIFTFYEKWSDSKGNIWFKAHWNINYCIEGYSMGKFSNHGSTYEEIWKFGKEPIEEWVTDGIQYFYLKWYRQE